MARAIRRVRGIEPRWGLYLPLLAVVVLAILWGRDTRATRVYYPQVEILTALCEVESSGRSHPPDGDGGAAIGPFQIHRAYWHDATQHDPRLGGTYEMCRNLGYAARVVRAYMERWAPNAWRAGNAEVVARTHNGGPEGPRNPATLPYWRRVQAALR